MTWFRDILLILLWFALFCLIFWALANIANAECITTYMCDDWGFCWSETTCT